ncbi:hypothetical protein XM38_026770 [Halomicronema hongdechloris C2206]|uniref:NADP-dependent oxidoreductase domain-containing protein n=2 Tax=Halomicronema hongdechloris TaxID=1209493 RepID=A0A1Z3HN29_9CYAN|nr:hypothetical protein XM38_026770 [Halomicronema hongdechloris C2206]
MANVAVRYVLEQPTVAGAIVGARLSIAEHIIAEHIEDNSRVFDFALTDSDQARLQAACQGSHDLFQLIGDCGDEYRR